jgi:hypothetical protein
MFHIMYWTQQFEWANIDPDSSYSNNKLQIEQTLMKFCIFQQDVHKLVT